MALQNLPQSLLPVVASEDVSSSRIPVERHISAEHDDDRDLDNLEAQVKQMAEQLLHYRTTLPHHLRTTFTSLISAQRPLLPEFNSASDPGPSSDSNAGFEDKSCKAESSIEEDEKTAEKVCLLKEKISKNLSAMPVVLKRMRECITRIDKLDSYNGIIHPAFKKVKKNTT